MLRFQKTNRTDKLSLFQSETGEKKTRIPKKEKAFYVYLGYPFQDLVKGIHEQTEWQVPSLFISTLETKKEGYDRTLPDYKETQECLCNLFDLKQMKNGKR